MGGQTDEPKSPTPQNSHENAELSIYGHMIDRPSPPFDLRPAGALKREFPWHPTKGGVGRYPAHE